MFRTSALFYSSLVFKSVVRTSSLGWTIGTLGLILSLLDGDVAAADLAPPCSSDAGIWRRPLCSSKMQYVDALRKARARLLSDPKGAFDLCGEALKIDPGAQDVRLLSAQALLFWGDPEGASRIFDREFFADRQKRRPVEVDTQTRVSAARAALLVGNYPRSLFHYRRAVLGLEELGSGRERARVLIEMATAASYAGPGNGREARTALRLAREQQAPLLGQVVDAAMSLSLLRDGEIVRSRRVAENFESSWKIQWQFDNTSPARGTPLEVLPVLPAGECSALAHAVALAVEPEAAAIHWEAYLDGSEGHRPPHLATIGTAAGP